MGYEKININTVFSVGDTGHQLLSYFYGTRSESSGASLPWDLSFLVWYMTEASRVTLVMWAQVIMKAAPSAAVSGLEETEIFQLPANRIKPEFASLP
jgi:hypothetical protein